MPTKVIIKKPKKSHTKREVWFGGILIGKMAMTGHKKWVPIDFRGPEPEGEMETEGDCAAWMKENYSARPVKPGKRG